jgi:hypothetical protein
VISLAGEVLAAGPVSDVLVAHIWAPMADAMPGWVSALAGATWAAQRASERRDQACEALTRERERLDASSMPHTNTPT